MNHHSIFNAKESDVRDNVTSKNVGSKGTDFILSVFEKMWFYQNYVYYIMPFVIFFGILNNSLTIIAMVKQSVSIPKRLKYYYIVIAGFDLVTIFVKDFLAYFIEDGFALYTKGSFYVFSRDSSHFACKALTITYSFGWLFSNYTLASLSVERMLVIRNPLKSAQYTSRKWVLTQWAVVVLPICLIALGLASLNMQLVPVSPDNPLNVVCSPGNPNPIIFYTEAWYGCFANYFNHAFIMLICSIFTASKLGSSISAKRELAEMQAESSTKLSSREIQAAITVMTLAILQCCIYYPSFVFCMIFCVASQDPVFIKGHPYEYAVIVSTYDLVRLTVSFAHCWNFYIYMIRISSFRRIFLCSKQASSSQSHKVSRTFTDK